MTIATLMFVLKYKSDDIILCAVPLPEMPSLPFSARCRGTKTSSSRECSTNSTYSITI